MTAWLKRLWRLGEPVRRPMTRKLNGLIKRSVDQSIAECLHPLMRELLVGVGKARSEVGTYRNETNLLLDSLVREVTRLQDELESIRFELEDAKSDRRSLTLVNHQAESA